MSFVCRFPRAASFLRYAETLCEKCGRLGIRSSPGLSRMNQRQKGHITSTVRQCRFAVGFVAALLVCLASPLKADDWEDVDELLTAVVGIHAKVPARARTAGSLGTERMGSGVLIDSNGLIVTIGYLIMEAEQVEISLSGGERLPVEVVAYDYETGFGLLRASAEIDLRPMELGSSASLELGEKMLIASSGGQDTVRPGYFCR